MKPTERIAELEKELAKRDEQIAGLTKALTEAKTVAATGKGKSKGVTSAEAGLKMLTEAGAAGVTTEQLIPIASNPQYPSDVVYYIRTKLNKEVKRVNKKYYLAEFAPATKPEAPKAEAPAAPAPPAPQAEEAKEEQPTPKAEAAVEVAAA